MDNKTLEGIGPQSICFPYLILNDLIITPNNSVPYFQWDKDFNIIAFSESIHPLLFSQCTYNNSLKLTDLIPNEYISALNQHLIDLQSDIGKLTSFSYKTLLNGISTTVIWLSATNNETIISLCCSLQLSASYDSSLSSFLKIIPTPALLIDVNGKYENCNNLMLKLLDIPGGNKVEDIIGKTPGTVGENASLCKYIRTVINVAKPGVTKEIQTTFTLSTGHKVYYLFSYTKHHNSIILIGLDITDVKQLELELLASEERNAAILKALPDVMKASSLRRKDDKMDLLINQLTNDPIFTAIPGRKTSGDIISLEKDLLPDDNLDKDLYSKLVRLEVETREINVRLTRTEGLLFLGEASFLNRMKYLEVSTKTLDENVNKVQKDLEQHTNELEPFRLIKKVIKMTPGGTNMFLTYLLVAMILLVFGVNYASDTLGIEQTIKNILNPSSLIQPKS